MTHDSWQRAKAVFHEALELPPGERADFLQRACGDDDRLRERVADLLRAHDEADDFLVIPSALEPGDEIGPYRVLEEIGAGGFGTVYRAEQTEPVRRDVALKILKPGMDTSEVIARFEAERQALALMNHPGIAQVFDAGTTGAGRPYFVMELVKGVPITRYCDEAALGTAERLELFGQVCLAIQHAHQKGIIHRDIKPSNVLVTLEGGRPAPKVIDFGVAKAIGPRLTDKTLVTMADQMIGTPEYMSPEQAELSAVDVDTRSDVYSLGVLLYELLTGTTPFDLGTLAEKGYLEMMRVIREEEPPRPSLRISTLGDRLARVAERRDTPARHLGKLVRGDLDWIVMKALEKDRGRRYETAQALARDVTCYLRDEPVEAGPPSASYRVRKFVRRHRAGVAAAVAVFLALVTGLTLATLGFVEARAQRDVAQSREKEARTEALRSGTVVNLMRRAFTAVDPHHARGAGYTVRQLLLAFDRDLGDSLESEPDVEATLRLTMGNGFRMLGLPGDAERHVARALELCRRLFGDEHERTIEALVAWAWVRHDQGNLRDSLDAFERVLALRRRLSPEDETGIARTLSAITDLHRHAGDHGAGIETGEQALALYRKGGGGTTGAPLFLPAIYLDQGRVAEAERLYRELLANFRGELGEGHPRNSRFLVGLAVIHRDRGEYAEAERLAREALKIDREFAGPRSVPVARSLTVLGIVLERARKYAEAEPVLLEAIAVARAAGPADMVLRGALQGLGDLYRQTGRYAEAERHLKECLEIVTRLFGASSPRVAQVRIKLGRVHYAKGEFDAAERLLREGIESLRAAWGDDHQGLLNSEIALGRVLYRTKRAPQAEELLTRVVGKLRTHYPEDRNGLSGALNALAISIRNQGRTPVDQLREAYEIDTEVWGEDRALRSRYSYGTALVATGNLEEGERILRGAYEGEKRLRGPAHARTLQTLKSLANCLDLRKRHAEAEPLWRELLSHRRNQKNPSALGNTLLLYGLCLVSQEKHAEAEPLVAECLKVQEAILPEGHWLRYLAMSLLGGCLAERKEFERAEPLLVEAYEMDPPPTAAHYKTQAKDRIVRLYEAWGKPEKARAWRAK